MLKIVRVTEEQFNEIRFKVNRPFDWYREIPCRNILLPLENILLVCGEDAACYAYPPTAEISIQSIVRQVS
jgi:hypothetical protein